jgi:hypothetical protein
LCQHFGDEEWRRVGQEVSGEVEHQTCLGALSGV